MFRAKKASLFPDRPPPPTWEQMEGDLKAATESDPIFAISPKTRAKVQTEHQERNAFSGDGDEMTDYDKEALFEQAVEFVEKNDELLSNIKYFNDNMERLEQASSNLKLAVEEVKKQASVAIDGY
ncbi:UPF0449 protein C19orf25 homolog [Procambarus clarkii]|uniref:UPF0449 protein C19orf25 homolog n=1 Tax=Procambarus clarkii TaxID=6728 RepID=UPI001E678B5A|nr:UPF0449 protein C19orf25 homolog [Procambarus clarkii]